MNLDEEFPELPMVRAGDPFVTRLVEFDDHADDLLNYQPGFAFYADEETAARARVEREETLRALDVYEIATLDRWLWLET